MIALLARANEVGARVSIPATALAQAMRQPAKHARLSRLIRQPSTALVALDGPEATSVGILLAASRTSDITDAHVVICARAARAPALRSTAAASEPPPVVLASRASAATASG